MLAIGFRFLAGRYHANPWGRHVNEADVEWPPAPWRVCRALISTWYHKLDHHMFPYDRLECLIDELGETLPLYHLPAAVHTHSRHYMPQWKGNTSLVFDAFARINADDELVMVWPQRLLNSDQCRLLDELLRCMGYLGRAESWVEARRLADDEVPADIIKALDSEEKIMSESLCRPGEDAVDRDTGEVRGEVVRLLAPSPATEYRQWRDDFVSNKIVGQRGKKKKLLQLTTPEHLTQALCLDTSELQQAGWSQPPASRFVEYLRPLDCLRQKLGQPKVRWSLVTTARFMLIGKPLPRIEDAIRVGEYFRAAVMSKAKYVLRGADNIPPALSGHDLGAGNRHGHAFYLPEDADADGRIDHMLLHAPDGLSREAQHVLSHLTLFRGRQGMEWQAVLEGIGKATDFSANSPYAKESAIWQSVTPYLRPWHLKKKPSELEQLTAFIRKECKLRGWIQNLESVERLPAITINGKARRVTRFHRFRNKRDITQPDTQGYFLRLQFSQPVSGPLALGFACHYGLGVFVPMNYCRNQAG